MCRAFLYLVRIAANAFGIACAALYFCFWQTEPRAAILGLVGLFLAVPVAWHCADRLNADRETIEE